MSVEWVEHADFKKNTLSILVNGNVIKEITPIPWVIINGGILNKIFAGDVVWMEIRKKAESFPYYVK